MTLGVGLFTSVSFFIDSSAAAMTKRAIAPVPIDMAATLTSPLASPITLTESVAPAALAAGQTATVTLVATNEGDQPASGVVIKDEPPSPLSYVAGSTALDGRALPDEEEQPRLAAGVLIAALPPKASARVTYTARAIGPVPITQALPAHATVASREAPAASAANSPKPVEPRQLEAEAARVRGVSFADRLDLLDLPAGSLRGTGPPLGGPVRVFAFEQSYLTHYPQVSISEGALAPDGAVLSVEASRALGATRGTVVLLGVPGRSLPISLPVSGVADLSRAEPLFASRNPDRLGEFVYVPNSIVVPPQLFEDRIVPALRLDAAAPAPLLKNAPLREVDVRVDRSSLSSDPASALIRARGLRRSIERIAPGQVLVADNLTRALTLARADAVVAKILFLFLGLPGVLLAAFLTGYAGSLLARAQRREHGILRSRGAQPAHLMRLLAYTTVEVASLGSFLGLALGVLTLSLFLGGSALFAAATRDLLISALLSVAGGMLATALALYVPGRRALAREVSEERREMSTAPTPTWLRFGLDFVLLAAGAVVELVLYLAGGFTPTQAEGQSVSLSFYLLLAPLMVWLGATLLVVRVLLLAAPRIPAPTAARFRSAVAGALRRSFKRRSWTLASGVVAVALAVALGVNVTIFTATYDAEKVADVRYVVGSDLRVTPSAVTPQPASFATQLRVPGVVAVTPLVHQAGNAVLGSDRKDLAAVDVAGLEGTAHLPDSFFVDGSSAAAMAALKADPAALLVSSEVARDFNIQSGDAVKVQLTDTAGREIGATFRAAGRFRHFPGFPQRVDLVANLGYYQSLTGQTTADFFLVRISNPNEANLTAVTRALSVGPGKSVPIRIDTIATAINRDQSTLADLNLHGLGRLDSLYTLLMSIAGIAIFVFALLLQRRKEYVTMRALGMRMLQLQGLVVGEAAVVALFGLVIGVAVGTAMAYMFVQILRPLFTLPPERLTFPLDQMGTLAILVLGGMVVSALLASGILRRLKPVELLREE